MEGLIQLLHSVTDKPVAVGFGVSGPEQVRRGFYSSGLTLHDSSM